MDISVIGPLEAVMQMASYFGHKAVSIWWAWCGSVARRKTVAECRCVAWRDIVRDLDAVARDTIEMSRRVLAETRAEVIVMGCTIVAAG